MKALGTGWRHGVRWRDIEVANDAERKATLNLGRRGARNSPRAWA